MLDLVLQRHFRGTGCYSISQYIIEHSNCGNSEGHMTLPTDEVYNAREHYTKYEYRIPMRDGVKLFTSVLVPKDASTTYPFIIVRTPFGVGPYGPDEYGALNAQTVALLQAGYIFVRQDV